MDIKQIKSIRNGDEVFWNDPDDGLCSRMITVSRVILYDQLDTDGDDMAITIVDIDGVSLECFASELV